MLSFQHEHALQEADFATTYNEDAVNFPLGPEPVLLTSIRAKRPAGGSPVLGLSGEDNRGIELALSDQLLHSLCKLLADTSKKADWGLELSVVQNVASGSPKVGQRLN